MNLDPLDRYTDDEIWQALDKVKLKKFIESLENRLLFMCLEGGENLRYRKLYNFFNFNLI